MTISSRIRRVTLMAATALALGLGGLAAAAPARAQSQNTCGWFNGVSPNGDSWENTTPGVYAFYFDEGLDIPYTGYVTCEFSNGVSTKLIMQSDGNFVYYVINGRTWGASTRPNGCTAWFQADGNLVVRNCGGGALWASNTHTYPHAILALQNDGNLVIYPTSSDFHALWATGT